jgi:integrase
MKWNSDFLDLPEVSNQNTPCFTAEEVSEIVKRGNGTSLMYKLAAGSGMRIGEILALEVKDFNGRILKVSKNLWNGELTAPKTVNGFREVDLSVPLAFQLSEHLRGRDKGFIFEEPRNSSSAMNHLNSVLEELKIKQPRMGYHSFRRYRITHLGKNKVNNELIRFWVGHSKPDVTSRYDAIHKDVQFRLAEAERVGEGF